uniref:Uncharacterized protein n=1 Tax=Tanacetum cinerariifolium TaxID=118510 RepID=A0A699GPM4_TANCI|nr:hypothetical protein [Tanacetum cinerariifolium]
MSIPTFTKTHNLISYLEKPTESEGFIQINDFLNGSLIKYALTASTTIHTSFIKKFWTSAKVKKVNDEVWIQALVHRKRVNIKESLIRHILRLDDAEVPKLHHGISSAALWHVPSFFLLPIRNSISQDLCTNLSNKVLDLKSEVIYIKSTFKAKIKKLESRVERLEEENRVLKELMGVHSIVDSDEPVIEKEKSSKHERKIADIDADVLSMLDVNDEEPTGVEEVVEVFIASKLITKVVTTAGVDVNAASVQDTPITVAEATKVTVEVPKPIKRRGVTIQDPKETTTTVTVCYFFGLKDSNSYIERNRPCFKIIRADGNNRLFMSFSTMMKNFDREDLEFLWKIIRERFEKTKPKNYKYDYLLNTLKIMFEKPNVEAYVWKDQKGKYGLEKMYPLTHFTLEQMVNDVTLEVDYESEMSLDLLMLVRRQLNEGNLWYCIIAGDAWHLPFELSL